ncbi:FYVE, RhoGEF and PH domain-containing protein 1 [Bulinus truncatus]|nr:FYVE, RhoGEF and PH domain-containing protein 1 [Bulinus truncatus]
MQLCPLADWRGRLPLPSVNTGSRYIDRILTTTQLVFFFPSLFTRSRRVIVTCQKKFPPRPKFIDKLLTGASNFTKKSPGKNKSCQSLTSQDSSKFYLDLPDDQSDTGSAYDTFSQWSSSTNTDEQNDPSGHLYVSETYEEQIVLASEAYGHNPVWDDKDTESDTCNHLNLSLHDKPDEVSTTNNLLDYSLEEIIYDISDTQHYLNLDNESFTHIEGFKAETNNTDNLVVSDIPVKAPESSASDPPVITKGFVKRQCQVFLQSLQSAESTPELATTSRKVKRSSSDLKCNNSLYRRPLSPHSISPDRWSKGYCDISRNSKFTEVVMAKGYVKALTEQINQQGALKHESDDDVKIDKFEDMGDDSFLLQFKDQNLRQSFVKDLIQAAESQSSANDVSQTKTKNVTAAKSGDHDLKQKATSSAPTQVSKSHLTNGNSINPQPSTQMKTLEVSPSHNRNATRSTSSPKQSPISSPKMSSRRSQSTSSSSEKPPVNYSNKPKVSPKKLSLTTEPTNFPTQKLSPSVIKSPVLKVTVQTDINSFEQNYETNESSLPLEPITSPDIKIPTFSPEAPLAPTVSNTESNCCVSIIESQNISSSVEHQDEVERRISSIQTNQQYRESVMHIIYDHAPTLNPSELFDSSWSDSDSPDESSDEENDITENMDNLKEEKPEHMISEPVSVPLEDKRFRIASELLQTERDYVGRLHLLHQVFFFTLDKENRQQQMFPPDVLRQMFSNTKSIFLFHHDFLLPQLEDRMKNWKEDPRIGDLMKKNAPFLKMYTEYIRNFDCAMKLINHWMEKSVRFSEIIREIQKQPECGSLSLQHHMLGPIQRVPRYELLLKDYVKHLPDNSPDKSDAKDALDLVTKAACHSNEAMKKIETFHKLLDIYQSLRGDVPLDFISPTREFVTQGPVTKISARSGEKQPRQIILFNDMVLVCSYLLGNYSVRSVLEVDSLEVKPGNNMHIPNTFMLRSKQKAVELLDENPSGECLGWKTKFEDVIAFYKQRKRFIKSVDIPDDSCETSVPESCLGKTAPVWIPDDAATMCMLCQVTFNMVRRRHHCRSCGKLICKSCCKKAPLEYKKGKIERVCSVCFDVIVNKKEATITATPSERKKGVLQVKASDPGLLADYILCSSDNGVSWQKLWVSARNDFALYTFRAHEDVSAIGSLPLPGHEVEHFAEWEGRQNIFRLKHKNKIVFIFQAENERRMKRWVLLLNKLIVAELPEEPCRLSSYSNSSNTSSDSTPNNVMEGNNRSSTHSGSQADSGYPGDSNSSLAALASEDIDHENADGISQSYFECVHYCLQQFPLPSYVSYVCI